MKARVLETSKVVPIILKVEEKEFGVLSALHDTCYETSQEIKS